MKNRKIGVRICACGSLSAAFIALVCAGCQSAAPAVEFHLRDESAARASSISTEHVKLAGAINEALSFSFSITPRRGPIREPAIVIQPFVSARGSLDASALEVFRLHAVRPGRLPGWHIRAIPPDERAEVMDALAPLTAPRGGMPRTLFAGQTYHFWADLHVPKGTSEGVYTTRLELRCGGQAVQGMEIELTVWPVVLPDEPLIPFIAELDHRGLFANHMGEDGLGATSDDWREHPRAAEFERLLTSTLRMLQSHGLAPVLPELSPTARVAPGGALELNWDHYDTVVEALLNGRLFFNRVGVPVWPLPTARLFTAITAASIGSAGPTDEFAREYLTQCIEHFEDRGWLARGYVLAPSGGDERMESAERLQFLGRALERADTRVRLATRRFPQDMASYGWVGFEPEAPSGVDVWMPPAQFYDVDAMADERRSGRATWMSVDRPPFGGTISIHAPATHTRVLSWQAAELGAEALHLGEVNDWPTGRANPTPEDCIRQSPETLLYPGGAFGLDEPVASVRLKHLRLSQQDAAYVRLLSEHGLGHVAGALRRELVGWAGSQAYRAHFADGRPIGWADDPLAFDLARRIMAEAMVSAASGTTGPSSLSQTATWRRFMSAAERVELHVDGSRVRLRGAPPEMAVEVETQLTVVNRRRVPASGVLRFSDLPAGWASATEDAALSVQPGSSRRVTLATSAAGVAPQPDGATLLRVEFVADDGVVYRQTARVSFMTAPPPMTPLRIDGDLSDWPPGAENVAANFRLISGEQGGREDAAGVSRPGVRTIAFVHRDGANLFIAVSCETGSTQEPPTSRRKGVRYDDLIPTEDEDLIEVLIDPSNAGTRSPSDLYHIAVKKSGTDVTEKGIPTDPPCGFHQPWPVDIDVAASTLSGRWMVEMRVPLSAISPDAHDHAIWGFNVTRWDAQRQEFSTWSAAVGNAYDPLSLGNLLLP